MKIDRNSVQMQPGIRPGTKLGFGCMRLPLLNSEEPGDIDGEQVKKMADLFFERGFSYVDTAYPYHEGASELAVGECISARFDRKSFLLADKMPVLKIDRTEQYEQIFQEQLNKCRVDYFDYYLLHNLGIDRYPKHNKLGAFDFLRKVKEEGRARFIGFSYHDEAGLMDRILTEHPEIDFVQLQINYLDWDSPVAQSGANYEVCRKHGKPVVVMEPVKGGTLASLPPAAEKIFRDFYKGKGYEEDQIPSPASLAIRFAASLPGVMMVLSGMSTLSQMEDNSSFMQDFMPVSDEELDLIDEIRKIIESSISVACTSCRYCMEVCPKNIHIPAYFGLLNLYAMTGKKTGMYYQRYKEGYGLAGECIHCGMCEKNCPQHLPIRDKLEEFAALYETKQ